MAKCDRLYGTLKRFWLTPARGHPAWRRGVEPWYLAYALLGAATAGIVPIVLPLLVYQTGGALHTGLVVAAYNAGGLTAPWWGVVADRHRWHRGLTLGGMAAAASGLGTFPWLTSPAARAGLALLQGMGAAGATTLANALIVETHPEAEWDTRLGWLQTLYAGGQVGGLLLAAAVAGASLHLVLLVAAGLTGAAAIIGWWTVPSAPTPTGRGAPRWPPRRDEWSSSTAPQPARPIAVALRRGRRGQRASLALFLGCWFCTFAGSWTFFGQYPAVMLQLFGVGPRGVSGTSAVAHGIGLLLYLPAGMWSEQRGPAYVLTAGLGVRALAFGSLWALGLTSFAGRGGVALLCVVIVVLSWSLLSVSGTALMARLSHAGEGEGMGLLSATTALAGIAGAALGGWAAELWGYRLALALPVIGVGLGLLLALAWPNAAAPNPDESET
jgi:MFS family permease